MEIKKKILENLIEMHLNDLEYLKSIGFSKKRFNELYILNYFMINEELRTYFKLNNKEINKARKYGERILNIFNYKN